MNTPCYPSGRRGGRGWPSLTVEETAPLRRVVTVGRSPPASSHSCGMFRLRLHWSGCTHLPFDRRLLFLSFTVVNKTVSLCGMSLTPQTLLETLSGPKQRPRPTALPVQSAILVGVLVLPPGFNLRFPNAEHLSKR